MSEPENNANGEGLMESLIGGAKSLSPSIVASEEAQIRISFERKRGGNSRLSVAYNRIDAIHYEPSSISITFGESRVVLTGVWLEEVYEALNSQTAVRII